MKKMKKGETRRDKRQTNRQTDIKEKRERENEKISYRQTDIKEQSSSSFKVHFLRISFLS